MPAKMRNTYELKLTQPYLSKQLWPPSADCGFSDRIQSFLADETLRGLWCCRYSLEFSRLHPSRSPFKHLATFTFQPYLLLDPTTTIIGIVLAAAVNTVALYYFTPKIQAFWSDYWATHHLIPEVFKVRRMSQKHLKLLQP